MVSLANWNILVKNYY